MKTQEFLDNVNSLGLYAYEDKDVNTIYIMKNDAHEYPIATVSTNIRYRYDITHRINELPLERGGMLISWINEYGNSPILSRTEQLVDKLITDYPFERLSSTRYRHLLNRKTINFSPNSIRIAGETYPYEFLELLIDIGREGIDYEY